MVFRFLSVVAVALSLLAPGKAIAQDPAPTARDTLVTHMLRLSDGSTLLGRLVSRDSSTIRFETNGGVLTIPVERVRDLRAVGPTDLHDDGYWFPDANLTRLFFAPTGRMLENGEGYYSNTYLFLQNFVGAPSDRFTMGGGFSIVPTSDFLRNNVYYLTPKFGIYNKPRVNVAVGMLAGWLPTDAGASARTNFGILYGVGTVGAPDASLTGGVGYGYIDGSLSAKPVLMLGGANRASRRMAFVTENYLTTGRDPSHTFDYPCTLAGCATPPSRTVLRGVASYGLRFMGEKISTDFALWNYSEHLVFPGFPYISLAVKF